MKQYHIKNDLLKAFKEVQTNPDNERPNDCGITCMMCDGKGYVPSEKCAPYHLCSDCRGYGTVSLFTDDETPVPEWALCYLEGCEVSAEVQI